MSQWSTLTTVGVGGASWSRPDQVKPSDRSASGIVHGVHLTQKSKVGLTARERMGRVAPRASVSVRPVQEVSLAGADRRTRQEAESAERTGHNRTMPRVWFLH